MPLYNEDLPQLPLPQNAPQAPPPAEAVPNPSLSLPVPPAANPFLQMGFGGISSTGPQPFDAPQPGAPPEPTPNPAAPSVPPAVAGAAEQYRQLGPEASGAQRQEALANYAGSLEAEKRNGFVSPSKDHYDQWFREHVTAPYNDPNKIGSSTLVTDAVTGRRGLDIPSLERENAARRAYDRISAERGQLERAENTGLEERSDRGMAFAQAMRDQQRDLARDTSIGKGYEVVFQNELARQAGQLDDIMARSQAKREQAAEQSGVDLRTQSERARDRQDEEAEDLKKRRSRVKYG